MIILSFILQMQEVRLGEPKSRGDCPSARGAPRRGDTGEWQHTWGWPQGRHFGERSPLGPHGVPRVGKGTLSRARVEMPLAAAHGAGGTAVGCRRWRGPMRLPRRQTESSQRCGTWGLQVPGTAVPRGLLVRGGPASERCVFSFAHSRFAPCRPRG